MNIYDISKKTGFSIATVSRVINGKPNVSESTRRKVEEVMRDNEYIPNEFARGLGLNSVKTIGVMCADVMDMTLAGAVSVTENELRKHGYYSILCCTGSEYEDKRMTLKLLLSKRVDAVIMVGSQFCLPYDNTYIAQAAEKVPVILINGYVDAPNVYCNYCNDSEIVYNTMNKLIEQGHSKILYLYQHESQSGKRKRQGYLRALADSGLLEMSREEKCPLNIEKNINFIMELFKADKFTAVLAAEDHLAVSALKAASNLKINVPNELALIGYNNSILALCTEPEITSIDNHLSDMCISSVNTLLNVINGKSVLQAIINQGHLIVRNTTNF